MDIKVDIYRICCCCCTCSFHVNAGTDGSSFSSPLESPDAPITSSVATLQSAESLSLRRQVRLSSGHYNEPVVVNPCHQAQPDYDNTYTIMHNNQISLSQTPDTPSANISPTNISNNTSTSPSSKSSNTSEHSQAFTSHFTSESSLVQKVPEETPSSPSAILTPSTDISPDADVHYYSEDLISLKFDEDSWDIEHINREFQSINTQHFYDDNS